MSNEIQINDTLLNISGTSISTGIVCGQYACRNIPISVHSFGQIKNIFNSLGLNSVITNEMDINYYLTDWKSIQKIIEKVFIVLHKIMRYLADRLDCDNFAWFASTLAGWISKSNSLGEAYGDVFNATTGEHLFPHHFNLPLVYENGIFSIYCFDFLNADGWIKLEPNKEIVMGNWRYKIIKVNYF